MKNQFLLLILIATYNLAAQTTQIDYGQTKAQTEILNLDCLHQRGFTGKGVTVAHFDDGYDGFDKMEAFDYARKNNLLKGQYDFVYNGPIKYTGIGSHGTNTLSVVNGYLPGEYVGAAFDANILLAHTEDVRSETHQEEKNWRRAVDWALENKADIITSSLQYNTFDKGEGDYSYKDMDGKTTIITNAADYASSKGILVVAIQGNFGTQDWHYVTAPGDADSVLTVGAMDVKGVKAGFSSFGPTIDGRIKPDVMAVGQATIIIDPDNKIRPGNGTSFAGPAIAGLVACLKQAHPDRSNMEIIAAVRQSSSKYLNPDKREGYGYGTPDACKADEILGELGEAIAQFGNEIERDNFFYEQNKKRIKFKPKFSRKQIRSFEVINAMEKKEFSKKGRKRRICLRKLEPGNYLLKVRRKDGVVLMENFIVK
ncbi:MAG: S8 family serine peptidase [Saprospiraceae bacterium]